MFELPRCIGTLHSGGVQRYHAVPSVLDKQRVDSHAWSVAMIVLCLTEGTASRDLLLHALLHDAAEIVTGDIPYTVKRSHVELKSIVDAIADSAHEQLLYPLPPLMKHETALLKMADTLDGWRWCQLHEAIGPVSNRWAGAYANACAKFAGVLSEDVLDRAALLYKAFDTRPTTTA